MLPGTQTGNSCGMADWDGGPPIQKGGLQSVFQLQGDHTPKPPKVYSRVLEGRVNQIVSVRIQEEHCGFRPGHGTPDWHPGRESMPPTPVFQGLVHELGKN